MTTTSITIDNQQHRLVSIDGGKICWFSWSVAPTGVEDSCTIFMVTSAFVQNNIAPPLHLLPKNLNTITFALPAQDNTLLINYYINHIYSNGLKFVALDSSGVTHDIIDAFQLQELLLTVDSSRI